MELKIMLLDVVVNGGIMTPELIDFNYLSFHKKKTTAKGMLSRVEYYESFDGEDYFNLIVDVSYEYIFQNGIYTGSISTVNWINTEEEIGHQTVTHKEFTAWEKVDFGMTKRTNILSVAKLYVFQTVGLVNATDLLTSVGGQIELYVNGANPTVLTDQVNSLVGQKPYLTQPIANAINAILSDI